MKILTRILINIILLLCITTSYVEDGQEDVRTSIDNQIDKNNEAIGDIQDMLEDIEKSRQELCKDHGINCK